MVGLLCCKRFSVFKKHIGGHRYFSIVEWLVAPVGRTMGRMAGVATVRNMDLSK